MTQRKEFCNSRTFSSPSPVVDPEVSAQWTRDGRGEVLISLKVPRDIVDAELFVKTAKGTLWNIDGPLELIQLEKVLEPVTYPQQDHIRRRFGALDKLRLKEESAYTGWQDR